MATGKHTIILIQTDSNYSSRSYMDFQGVNAAMDGVVKVFEHRLKELKPNSPQITYDISDLYNYLDELPDLCALV